MYPVSFEVPVFLAFFRPPKFNFFRLASISNAIARIVFLAPNSAGNSVALQPSQFLPPPPPPTRHQKKTPQITAPNVRAQTPHSFWSGEYVGLTVDLCMMILQILVLPAKQLSQIQCTLTRMQQSRIFALVIRMRVVSERNMRSGARIHAFGASRLCKQRAAIWTSKRLFYSLYLRKTLCRLIQNAASHVNYFI